jgi:catechol 2,3-dioxygenase-like lactoylglutathione lyase family enzyme
VQTPDIDNHQYLVEDPMSRIQLALNVVNLEESIAFYSTLFGTAPAKTKPGYANFAVAEPPLKLVLIENPGNGGSINHLGVEVTDVDTVDAELTRLGEAGLASVEERDTTCCYAKQDKFWVQDAPNGERWEIYTVLSDSDTFSGQDDAERGTGCCATDNTTDGAGRELAASVTSCC